MAATIRLFEELYFDLVKDAHDHGYDVLTFSGPGQGLVLTEQSLPFTYEWEKPTSAVMDTFLAQHECPRKLVLIGQSMGGYLAKGRGVRKPFRWSSRLRCLFRHGSVGNALRPQGNILVGWSRHDGVGQRVD